jgi:hypothetical protein
MKPAQMAFLDGFSILSATTLASDFRDVPEISISETAGLERTSSRPTGPAHRVADRYIHFTYPPLECHVLPA